MTFQLAAQRLRARCLTREATATFRRLRAPLLLRDVCRSDVIPGVGTGYRTAVCDRADHTQRPRQDRGHRIHRQVRRASRLHPHRGSCSRGRPRTQGGVLHTAQQPVHGARLETAPIGETRGGWHCSSSMHRCLRGLTAFPIDADTSLEGEEPITAIGHPIGGGNWSVIPGSVTSRQAGWFTLQRRWTKAIRRTVAPQGEGRRRRHEQGHLWRSRGGLDHGRVPGRKRNRYRHVRQPPPRRDAASASWIPLQPPPRNDLWMFLKADVVRVVIPER